MTLSGQRRKSQSGIERKEASDEIYCIGYFMFMVVSTRHYVVQDTIHANVLVHRHRYHTDTLWSELFQQQ